jgi:translocation and assembly module TamB
MVPAINTRFQDLTFTARIEPPGQLGLEGGGTVGHGDLRMTGGLDLASERLTGSVVIDNVRAVDLPDYSATVEGDLNLEMTSELINVTGALVLPEASITISELPETAVGVSSDEVVVGEAPRTQQNRRTRVSLTLGDYVRFKAFGLDTRLVGELELRETPGVPPELVGTIQLREGIFEAYGQSFAIERGLLIFTGPIDNPEVDVIASQTVRHGDRDVLISLDITGTASALTTTIRSTPAMPEADAVSLLLTGRTISELSTQEQTNVYGAALSLGLMGARGLTDSLGAQLGLEEIILDQDPTGDVRVGAAIRINRDLYFRYTYGAFSRIGGALLRYRLTDRISLQGQTGDTHSIEIRYGVD